jgi:hypothetical protein
MANIRPKHEKNPPSYKSPAHTALDCIKKTGAEYLMLGPLSRESTKSIDILILRPNKCCIIN